MAGAVVGGARAVRARALDAPSRVVDDDELLTRVAGGDRIAFASLYDHLASAAYGLARRVVRDHALAEEITQDAFLQVWSTGGSFDRARGSARRWIMTVVHRRAVDVVRHEQSARERLLQVGIGSVEHPFDTVWATALQSSERDQVVAALDTLTGPQRLAIELAYFEGMTYREVAVRLEIPEGTAKSRIHVGVRRLRRALLAADR